MKALILVDIQNDYFKGGKNELYHTDEVLEHTKKVIKRFRVNKDAILYIKHVSMDNNASFFVKDTYGCEINSDIKPKDDEKVIIKHEPNCFHNTELLDVLRELKIDNLVICGMMSHMCIDSTVRSAYELGFKVTVIEDACTTKNLVWKDKVVTADLVNAVMMSAIAGTFADICTEEEWLSGNELKQRKE